MGLLRAHLHGVSPGILVSRCGSRVPRAGVPSESESSGSSIIFLGPSLESHIVSLPLYSVG